MLRPKTFLLILLVMGGIACQGLSDLSFTLPTPTPTFIMARFATATFTPSPTARRVAAVGTSATPTPTAAVRSPLLVTPTPTAEETTPTATPTRTETPTITPTPPPPTPTPTETPSPTPAPMAGRIAFPVDDGGGHYDVWVFEPPDGDPFLVQAGARQPNFSKETGQLLVNNQNNSYGEHIGLLDANYSWLGEVSGSPYDSFPYWNPEGTLYTYSNPQMLTDPITGDWLPHVFIPCSLKMPTFEEDLKCRDIGSWGKVAIGEYPVWTEDDRIALFNFEGEDGLYVVNGASKLWQAGGLGPPQPLIACNGRPSDTEGFQVFFSAGNLDQNWEAYMIDLDGNNLVNLSNSPTSQDGLPTVSPDGNWVAFVSDRDGGWGIWAIPRHGGGEPQKLLDYGRINTNPNPWGTGDRHWTLERISWGPPN